MKIGTPPWCCPRRTEFWRLCCASWRSAYGIGAVAGNRARTSSLAARHSAVKSQPRKLKGPEASLLLAHAISTKNKHLLATYSVPARGFTAAVSVFRGTPPPKPLICKSVLNHFGARFRPRWADPTGEELLLLCAILSFAVADIIKTSFDYRSQMVHISSLTFTSVSGKQKTLLPQGKQGRKNLRSILYLLTSGLSKPASGFCPRYDLDRPRLNTQPWLNRL